MLFWESSTFQTMPLSINIYLRNGSVVKNPSASVGDPGLIPGLGRSPGEVNMANKACPSSILSVFNPIIASLA